ncbi:MAG: aldo/keto reductase [Armatimonadetes bacterium]|nr:aldo/keto reductase [Armatimonadota bacterium]
MPTRRFGRTELQMPVFSCGGMRFQQGWGDSEPEKIEKANQERLEATVHRALQLGINHIETARGYGPSEMQLGWVLPQLPREKMIVQTKVSPNQDPKEFLQNFEKSMGHLKLDYVDLLSFHGVNNAELLDQVVLRGGCLEIARRLQKEGRVRFVGFSTHASNAVITRANATGEFDYLNLHYYFVNELNWGAIEEATRQDMGVFIISPTDKGGMLQSPPEKMKELCAPLTPMAFNDLWCLNKPEIHTLSIGAARPSDFDEHVEALQFYDSIPTTIASIEARLREEMKKNFGEEWVSNWPHALPEHYELPNDVNVREILRVFTYAKSLDLVEWAKGRYNLLGNAGHWFPGQNLKVLENEEQWALLSQKLKGSPFAAQIPAYLHEAHEMLKGEEKQRQSQE